MGDDKKNTTKSTVRTITLDEIGEQIVDSAIVNKILTHFFMKNIEDEKHPSLSQESGGVVVFSCADSRVLPAHLLRGYGGDIYGIRNVANTMFPYFEPGNPKYKKGNNEVVVGLDYAINFCGADKIIVMGHTDCGGAEAILTGVGGPVLKTYLNSTSAALEHKNRIQFFSENDQTNTLIADLKNSAPYVYESARRETERDCLHASLKTIKAIPFIAQGLKNGNLSLVGITHDIVNSRLEVTCDDTAKELRVAAGLTEKYSHFKKDAYGEGGPMPYLVEKGQHPETLIITGMRTAFEPERLGIMEGEALVHRRLGAKYNPIEENPDSLSGSIEFAVDGKGVKTIIILGKQGDVHDTYMAGGLDKHPLSKEFIESCTPAIAEWRQEKKDTIDVQQESLRMTVNNTLAHPSVQKTVEAGKLSVVALLINPKTGEILYLDPKDQKFSSVESPL